MDDTPYSTREITELFKRQDERADEFHDRLMERMDSFEADVRNSLQRQEIKLSSIEVQTTKTNGSVAKAHENISTQNNRLGMLAVAVIVILVLKFPEILSILQAAL